VEVFFYYSESLFYTIRIWILLQNGKVQLKKNVVDGFNLHVDSSCNLHHYEEVFYVLQSLNESLNQSI